MKLFYQAGFLLVLMSAGRPALVFADDAAMTARGYTLERAVLVMRHGVRPPTKSAQAMASLSDQAWPDNNDWGAAPGELTPHGAQAIEKLGADLRTIYSAAGLIAVSQAGAEQFMLWGDGADQRTRKTAQILGKGLAVSGTPDIQAAWLSDKTDPLFDGLVSDVCQFDPDIAQKAAQTQTPLDTPEVRAALKRLQEIMAPDACQSGVAAAGGRGVCLSGQSGIEASATGVKLTGPLATGATVSEILLLEYENGMPMERVGFGRASREDIGKLLLIHEHASDLTRVTPYIAVRRAGPLVRFILTALIQTQSVQVKVTPVIAAPVKLIVLTGHDTNLSNLAGVFGFQWKLPGQPDVTAPGTAIAFERWRNQQSGRAILRTRLFYQGMDQVRNLSTLPVGQVELKSSVCAMNQHDCELVAAAGRIEALLPEGCK